MISVAISSYIFHLFFVLFKTLKNKKKTFLIRINSIEITFFFSQRFSFRLFYLEINFELFKNWFSFFMFSFMLGFFFSFYLEILKFYLLLKIEINLRLAGIWTSWGENFLGLIGKVFLFFWYFNLLWCLKTKLFKWYFLLVICMVFDYKYLVSLKEIFQRFLKIFTIPVLKQERKTDGKFSKTSTQIFFISLKPSHHLQKQN